MRNKSDDTLKQRVLEQIRWHPGVASSDIGVTADNGTIALFGHVDTVVEKAEAVKAAWRVRGVRAVADEIDVRMPDQIHNDEGIAKRVLSVLDWNIAVPENAVTATVDNGHVTLSGEVEWNYQREAAERCVMEAGPVTGVTNRIVIKPKMAPANIENRITGALKRYADINAEAVEIAVKNGTVKLTGTVDTFRQRKIIEKAAWSAPGVSKVENYIGVHPGETSTSTFEKETTLP